MSTNRVNQSVKLTKTVVDKLRPPATGQIFVRDSVLQGFAVRITANGTRAFIVEKRINGRVRRQTLGRYGALTVEQARKLAQRKLGEIASGIDPIAEKRKAQLRGLTLQEVYRDYRKARKDLKPITLRDYDRVMDVVLRDWRNKPITAITKAMVAKKHRELGDASGGYYANLAMRLLRAVLNFAQATYDDGAGHSLILENPVLVLTRTRAWYRTERRRTVIKPHQLPAWYRAVRALADDDAPESANTASDYLLLLLFTGLRAGEARRLRWVDVDLDGRTLTIPDTKNRRPHTLPLSTPVFDMLTARVRVAVLTDNPYVFPGRDGRGHLVEVKRQVARVIAASGVSFTLHDLRRTFATTADRLDISAYAIKRLVNHATAGDVTAGYIIDDIERLRRPMQAIADRLLADALANPPAELVAFPPARAAGG